MRENKQPQRPRPGAREKLLDAFALVRAKGYSATSVDWSAQSLALHTQAVLQGAFILAKAKGAPEVAAAGVDHLRRYIELLFETGTGRKRRPTRAQASSGSLARCSSSARASASCFPGA